MPELTLLLYREPDGEVPLLDWLASLQLEPRVRCYMRLERLKVLGHELRRPEAEYLGSELYELRAKCSGHNYRMIYFFHGRSAVVLSHGFTKQEARVSSREIAVATKRKQLFLSNPKRYSIVHEA
jgi:phage-related protein